MKAKLQDAMKYKVMSFQEAAKALSGVSITKIDLFISSDLPCQNCLPSSINAPGRGYCISLCCVRQVCGKYPQPDRIVPSYKVGWNKCVDEILKIGEVQASFSTSNSLKSSIAPHPGLVCIGEKQFTNLFPQLWHSTTQDWDGEAPGPEYFQEILRVSKNQIIFGCNYFNFPLQGGELCGISAMTAQTRAERKLPTAVLMTG